MSKYDDAIKLMEERCGSDREVILALATTSLADNAVPAVRMVCAYYEEGPFYVSTDSTSNKMLQIEKNNQVAVAGLDWFSLECEAENLGWVKNEENAHIRSKFKKVFDWFAEVGDEDNPDSIVLRITPRRGTVIDHERRYSSSSYEVDFVNMCAN